MFRNIEALFRTHEPAEILAHLQGQTVADITGLTVGSERVVFTCESGDRFVFWHSSDCCETVEVVQVDGDTADLIGSPLVLAEDVSSEAVAVPARNAPFTDADGDTYGGDESFTWTFYKFATVKGYVTVRWYGNSNGYYSERVAVACQFAGRSASVRHYGSPLDTEN